MSNTGHLIIAATKVGGIDYEATDQMTEVKLVINV